MDPLELAVQAALVGLCADPQASSWSGRQWTREVLARIGAVAQSANYVWLTNWLWDGVAVVRSATGQVVDMPLVLESEFGVWGDIWFDFEKLLAARSSHRVMVCCANTLAGAKTNLVRLQGIISAFQSGQVGDRYLLACWYGAPKTAGAFLIELHIVLRGFMTLVGRNLGRRVLRIA
jgi:hypothetical protein